MTPKVVIFDWDGTVIDSVDHIASSLHGAATELGFPAREMDAYRDIIGLGIIEALQKLYPGLDMGDINAIREGYARYFFSQQTTPQNIFPGVEALLTDLGKVAEGLAVATGKSRRGMTRALESTGLAGHFAITRCADETRSKPDPTMLREIMAHFGIAAEEAVMIGDTVYDMEMAQRIGMPAIGVEWGVHRRERLQAFAPAAIVSDVEELRQALKLA
ncbi:HAD family hydrolase [Marinobacter halodurans]|uniref:HAD family hydrolase n=1 Tax=Marinobacter halodurans TaxID=2528979 RepID=A0ABY1ZHZ5_9GAMM|nr:HAD-IA family hydrolase [Marinobacter halodurans]TBW48053.1 HAD family hydrolase [Marinobacter halodurans]